MDASKIVPVMFYGAAAYLGLGVIAHCSNHASARINPEVELVRSHRDSAEIALTQAQTAYRLAQEQSYSGNTSAAANLYRGVLGMTSSAKIKNCPSTESDIAKECRLPFDRLHAMASKDLGSLAKE